MKPWCPSVFPATLLVALSLTVGTSCKRSEPAPAQETVGGDRLATIDEVGSELGRFVEGDRFRVTYGEQDMRKGPSIPLVTIVEFSDFQCPYCARLTSTLRSVLSDYSEDVALVFRHLPLPMHPDAKIAAQAALAANAQSKGWELHDVAFDNQSALGKEQLVGYAQQVGVPDLERFERELDEGTYAAQIEDDMQAAAQWQVSSTPVFFVNGRPMKGAKSADAIRAAIDEELALAKRLMTKGAKRHEVYAHIMRAAKDVRKPPKPPARAGVPDPSLSYAVPTDGRPAKGPADALVTIVEFSDFQCPYCSQAADHIEQLAKQRPNVRVVFRHLPADMHDHAEEAAKASAAAEQQGKFWDMHDRLFALGKDIDPKQFPAIARELGLDVAQFEKDYASEAVARTVADDIAVADRFGVRGTPAFFVNGRYLTGAQPVENFLQVVDEEQTKAERAVALRGLKGPDLYASLTSGFETEVAGAEDEAVPARIADHRRRAVETDGLVARGDADAAQVSIVECSDFDCPFCREGAQTLSQVRQAYGDKVAVYWRHFPAKSHPRAEAAHRAAVAAEQQGKFWEMHDQLFADQKQRSDEQLFELAAKLGLDKAQFKADFAARETAARVQADTELCRRMGVRGTPTFFVNGRLMSGAKPLESFQAVIDEELAGGFEATARAARSPAPRSAG